MNADELFQLPLSLSQFGDFFQNGDSPWNWVGKIAPALTHFFHGIAKNGEEFFRQLPDLVSPWIAVSGNIWIHSTVKMGAFVTLEGPIFLGPHCEVRAGAMLRGNVICGANGVIGNSCEIKNSLLLDRVQVPHFNYVGDSILGNGSHLGAGAILANLRLDGQSVRIHLPSERVVTERRKLGAMLGDGAQVGCNAVLQPGAILGKNAIIGPATAFGGFAPKGSRFRGEKSCKMI